MSRTGKSTINSIVGIGCSLVSSLLSFVLQAVFIRLLGLEYSGINNLFSSILNILNIAELGISNAIMFRLYKTIANGDADETELYLAAYRKICYIVAGVIAAAGLCCIPFLDKLVKDVPAFPESLWSLFIIVLATSVGTHGLNYCNIMLLAKQERYINTLVQYGCIFLCHGLQIAALAIWKNIYLYLFIKLFTSLAHYVITGIICRRRYGITWHSPKRLPKEEKTAMTKDVGTLAIYKFCRTLDASIDTFFISKFIAVATTAIYGSISMLLSGLNELLGAFNDGMTAGIGDLYASADRKRIYDVFKESTHFTFLIYGVCTAVLCPFLSSFIQWWIGHTLPDDCIYVMLLNFYMYGMGMNVSIFRNSMGLFTKGWKRPAVTALLNFVFSLWMIRKIGLIGTLIGTLIARTFTLVWFDPYIVCKYGLEEKPGFYYVRYIIYLIFTTLTAAVMLLLGRALPAADTFISLLWHGIVYLCASSAMLFCLGFVFPEQKAIIRRCLSMLKNLKTKLLHR